MWFVDYSFPVVLAKTVEFCASPQTYCFKPKGWTRAFLMGIPNDSSVLRV